jgi:hypothetical protein
MKKEVSRRGRAASAKINNGDRLEYILYSGDRLAFRLFGGISLLVETGRPVPHRGLPLGYTTTYSSPTTYRSYLGPLRSPGHISTALHTSFETRFLAAELGSLVLGSLAGWVRWMHRVTRIVGPGESEQSTPPSVCNGVHEPRLVKDIPLKLVPHGTPHPSHILSRRTSSFWLLRKTALLKVRSRPPFPATVAPLNPESSRALQQFLTITFDLHFMPPM